jgi:hypothetical protein
MKYYPNLNLLLPGAEGKCSRQLTNVSSILTKKRMTDYVLSITALDQESTNKCYFTTQKSMDCLVAGQTNVFGN